MYSLHSSSFLPARGGGFLSDGAGANTLMRFLVESAVIHPEEWDNLTPEAHRSLAALGDREALLSQLGQLNLINDYQASCIKAGQPHTLVLGNYRLLGKMGKGGSGIVFEAEHVMLRRKVAVKVLPVRADDNPTLMTRFLREMRTVSRLDHPNIVAAFDAGICSSPLPGEPDLYYFAMEHLAGRDLERQVHHEALTVPAACTLIYQIASALDEAHRHLLVHRDIKPSNVFVTEARQAKLLDFGLVRHMLSNPFTAPDVVVGTLEYMAPEQALDPTQVDIRTDIFGLGATFFFALIGASPFPVEGTLVEAVLRRRHQKPLSAHALRGDVPEALERIVQRMLALRAADRYATPQAVMHALLPFLESQSRHGCQPQAAPSEADLAPGTPAPKPPRVLIVDGDADQRRQFARVLANGGFDILQAADAESALLTLRNDPTEVVLLAVHLPGADGRATLKALRDNPPCPNLKILMTSARSSPEEMSALLKEGADDYLRLPVSAVQMNARVKSAFRHKQTQDRINQLSRQLIEMNTELERSLSARTTDLVQGRNALVLALARLVEYRSTETIAHLTRMQRYCVTLAQEAALISAFAEPITQEFIQTLECCAPLHDIGKVRLPDNILLKGGRLDEHETEVMRTHAVIGADTLQHVARRFGEGAKFLRMAIDIARHHHEEFDGSGYPDGLAGNDIPLPARIVAIADAYDALRSRRSHRPCLSHTSALQIMLETSVGKFDPLLLGAFQRCAPQFERIFRELPDSINFE